MVGVFGEIGVEVVQEDAERDGHTGVFVLQAQGSLHLVGYPGTRCAGAFVDWVDVNLGRLMLWVYSGGAEPVCRGGPHLAADHVSLEPVQTGAITQRNRHLVYVAAGIHLGGCDGVSVLQRPSLEVESWVLLAEHVLDEAGVLIDPFPGIGCAWGCGLCEGFIGLVSVARVNLGDRVQSAISQPVAHSDIRDARQVVGGAGGHPGVELVVDDELPLVRGAQMCCDGGASAQGHVCAGTGPFSELATRGLSGRLAVDVHGILSSLTMCAGRQVTPLPIEPRSRIRKCRSWAAA